jgi:hypothetical protein
MATNNTNNDAARDAGQMNAREFKNKAVYVLTRDVENPKPDRRVRDDWRVRPRWLVGTRFTVREEHINDKLKVAAIVESGRWTHHTMLLRSAPAALLAALEEITPTVDEALRFADLLPFKSEAVDLLIANGTLTLDQFLKAAEAAADEWDTRNQ